MAAAKEFHMPDAPRPCDAHPELVGFKFPLPHLSQSLKRERKIRIVAIGSSSTAGEGKIVPYPCRLELALRDRYNGTMVDVLSGGIGGGRQGERQRVSPLCRDEALVRPGWHPDRGTDRSDRWRSASYERLGHQLPYPSAVRRDCGCTGGDGVIPACAAFA